MAEPEKISILIVDSDVLCRDILTKAFAGNVDIQVVDTAPTGTIGLMKAGQLKPDVILLDAALADYQPARFIRELFTDNGPCGIILTLNDNAPREVQVQTIKALEAGAFDFIVKPHQHLATELRISQFIGKLVVRIRAYSIRRFSRLALQTTGYSDTEKQAQAAAAATKKFTQHDSRFRVLLIGVSTGGPQALLTLIPGLPRDFPLPVVIVIHLPDFFTASLAGELDKNSALQVEEAKEDDTLTPGRVYLARGGQHLLLEKKNGTGVRLHYSTDPPVNNCRPSVDVLFRSAAGVFGAEAIGIILTGMGHDGAEGIRRLKQCGAHTLAQDKDTSIVWGMPGAAVATGCVDEVLPLGSLIPRLLELPGL